MPALSSEARFLGVDLTMVIQDVRQAWSRAQTWPLFSWLTPSPPVVLFQADGSKSIFQASLTTRFAVRKNGALRARINFAALELPAGMVLTRDVHLPAAMRPIDVRSALELQVHTFSPFPKSDLIWGSTSLSGVKIPPDCVGFSVVLAARSQVDQYVQGWLERQTSGAVPQFPEVWASTGSGSYVSLPGPGLVLRERLIRRQRNFGYALLLCVLVLATMIAITPTIKLRMQALQAATKYEETMRRVEPVLRDRENLVKAAGKLNALSGILRERIEPLRVIDTLTQILPDDAALQSLHLSGTKVSMSGQAADSAQLMQKLGQHPGIREVKAPSPAIRLQTSSKESFSIEFVLDPAYFGTSELQAAEGGASGDASAVTVSPAPRPPASVRGAP